MKILSAFLANQRGTSTVLLAVSLPVMVLAVGGGIDMSRAISMRQTIASAIEIACKQSALEINHQASQPGAVPNKNYNTVANGIAVQKINDSGVTATPTSTVAATTISITAVGTSTNVFGGVLGYNTVSLSVQRDCSRNVSPPPQGEVMLMESWETGHNVAPNSWTVLKNWNGWKTQDAGIEINGMRQLAGNVMRFGDFFAELDSHCYVANCNSNSTMSWEVKLEPGDYELRYWYVSRILNNQEKYNAEPVCGTEAKTSWATWEGQTNRIEVYVEREGDYSFKSKSMVDLCIYSNHWTERKIPIVVSKSGNYRISWRAAGKQDTMGGLLDYLRFCTKTCP